MQVFWFGSEHFCGSSASLGPQLLTAYPANRLLLDMLKAGALQKPCRFWLPESARTQDLERDKEVFFYPPEGISGSAHLSVPKTEWVILANGAVLSKVDRANLEAVLCSLDCDIAVFRIDPSLDAGREQVRLTRDGRIVGFRRSYQPVYEPDFPSADWPDFFCCRAEKFEKLLSALLRKPTASFAEYAESVGGRILRLRIGGRRFDLFSTTGLAALLRFSQTCRSESAAKADGSGRTTLKGIIHIGREVRLGQGAVIAAPAILCDRAEVGDGAVLQGVLLGPSVCVPPGKPVHHVAWWRQPHQEWKTRLNFCSDGWSRSEKAFREWPLLSYPRFGKRLVDILISLLVLGLFLPFFPLIALAVKLTSPGPVFFRARRQGLHGREFSCLKFRTMIVGAESLQDQLRMVNQVDGPQFKMDDDPRTSPIGKFLRDTCIDELPQFLNVLLGQMSVAGPRPSPENENEYCPPWRQARLSVRPGITGLWQVSRTRRPGRDFQEWIYYDMEYVRKLSLGMDLKICLLTARKLILSFLDQFG
ncbi:MAG: sugar transferase [Anaerohalosphaeraceae bacterium]